MNRNIRETGGEKRISRVLISTALGPGGGGIFPYTLLPSYRRLIRTVKETETTVITKSATRYRRQGNFIPGNPFTWRYIRRISGQGMLNAYGLTNQGVRVCAREVKQSCSAGIKVVPNYYPEFAKGTETAIRETLESIKIYKEVMGSEFWALELNFSCPNAKEAVAENVNQGIACVRRVRRNFPELFLIAKISIVHPFEFSEELERLGVKAIHGVNTIPYNLVFPKDKFPPSPLADVGGGGVSGGPACPAARKYNAESTEKGQFIFDHGLRGQHTGGYKRLFGYRGGCSQFLHFGPTPTRRSGKNIKYFKQLRG